MKKTIALILAVLLTVLALSACGTKSSVTPEEVAGHYRRKNDIFSIVLNADSTYQYYESEISSHIGMGNYTIDGDVITLEDKFPGLSGPITCYFRFRYEDGKLFFLADQSDQFMYVKLPDGATFER